jgi:putative inorganic carbon (HCO3(-)) transporter
MAAPVGLKTRYSLGSHPLPGPVAAICISVGASAIGVMAGSSPAMALALAAGAVLVVAVAVRPEIATLVVLAVLYSNAAVLAVTYHGMPAFISATVPMLLIAPLVYLLLVQREPFVLVKPQPWVIGFGLVQVAGTIASSSSETAVTTLGTYVLEGVGIYVLVTNVVRRADMLHKAVWILLGVGGVLGLLSLVQSLTGDTGNEWWGFAQASTATFGDAGSSIGETVRLGGPLAQNNRYAQIMLVLVPLGIFRYMAEQEPWRRAAAATATLLIVAGVVLSYSRGAAVGLAIAFIAMAALRYVRVRTFVVVAVLVVCVVASVPQYRARLLTLTEVSDLASESDGSSQVGTSIAGRATENVAAFYAFAEHPLLGVGPGLFGTVYGDYAERVQGDFRNVKASAREAHNLYLGVAAENGVPGIICLGGVFAVTLRELGRARRRCLERRPDLAALAAGFIVAIVAYMASAVFLHFAFIRYFWLLMALAAATARIALEAVRREDEDHGSWRNGLLSAAARGDAS